MAKGNDYRIKVNMNPELLEFLKMQIYSETQNSRVGNN